MKATNLRDFDDAMATKLYHYTSVDNYYRDFSSVQRIEKIKCPMLGISSMDDPITVR